MRYLPSDDKLSLRGGTLRAAVDEDLEAGLIPFYVRIIFSLLSIIRDRSSPGTEVIKLFSCSAQTKIYPAHKY